MYTLKVVVANAIAVELAENIGVDEPKRPKFTFVPIAWTLTLKVVV